MTIPCQTANVPPGYQLAVQVAIDGDATCHGRAQWSNPNGSHGSSTLSNTDLTNGVELTIGENSAVSVVVFVDFGGAKQASATVTSQVLAPDGTPATQPCVRTLAGVSGDPELYTVSIAAS